MNVQTPPARAGKRWLTAVLAALACLAQSGQAAISITAGTTGPLAFDVLPVVADGWSTLSLGTAAGTIVDAAAMDAAVNAAVNAANVTTALGQSATLPPSQQNIARWNSAGFYLQTRPTGNDYLVLMATLQNDSGATITEVTVSYDWAQRNPVPVAEQVPGHRAYYSLTGAPGSWVLIPEFSNFTVNDTAFALTAVLPGLTAWEPGTPLYLLWADDNGSGSTADPQEGAYTIDNVSITANTGAVTPFLGIRTPTNGATFNASVPISVTTAAAGLSSVDFRLNGVSREIDPAAPFAISIVGLAPGSYTLSAIGTITAGGTLNSSNTVTFTILANQAPFISLTNPPTGYTVLVGTAITNFVQTTDDVAVVRVEWFLDGNPVYNRSNANWSYCYNDSKVGAHTIMARAFDAAGLSTDSATITVNVNNPLAAAYAVVLPNGSTWNYWATNSAPLQDGGGADWLSYFYVLETVPGWLAGAGELGNGDNSLTPGDAFYPETTPIDIGAGTRFSTIYFRTTVTPAGNPLTDWTGGLLLRLLRDDGAVVYINSFPVWTNNLAPTALPVPYADLAPAAAADDGTVYVEHLVPAAELFNLGLGEGSPMVICVEVHQSSTTSSDLSFDLMAWGAKSTIPTVTITSPTNNASFASTDPVTVNVTAAPFADQVEFYVDGVLVGTDTTRSDALPNFSFPIPSIPTPGAHVLTVVGVNTATAQRSTSGPVNITITFAGQSVIAYGATWKYLDDGSDQGTAWQALGFVDGAWPAGPAELGFGEADEATTVRQFSALTQTNIITYYFRHTFNLASLAGISNATLRVLRDDGVVVYLNGTEVHRGNMPPGTVNYLTFASAASDEANQTDTNCVPPGLLRVGDNVIAAEIHQANYTSSDVSFNLALLLNKPPTALPTVAITNIVSGAQFLAGPVTIAAAAADPDCGVALVEFFVDGVSIGTDTTSPYAITWTATVGNHTLTARVQSTQGTLVISAPVTVTVNPGPDLLVLVNTNSTWKYLDDGSDQGTAWQATLFNDGTWPSGPAELGFGDNDEATVLSRTNVVTGTTNITFYFRHGFNSPNPSPMTNLLIRLRRDDGGIVYLNGVEVFRSNMPQGPVTYQTLAPAGTTSETAFFETNIAPSVLVAGANMVAVEVHQDLITSSDISFEFQLVASGPPGSLPTDRLTIVLVDHDSNPNTPAVPELQWTGAGYTLIQTSDVSLPRASWTAVGGAVSGYRPPVVAGGARFYALKK